MRPHYLLACILVGGCAQDNAFDVDASFTPEECQEIKQAATDWEIAVRQPIKLTFGVRVDGDLLGKHEIIRATSRTYHNYSSEIKNDIGFTNVGPFGSHVVLVIDRIHNEPPHHCQPGVPCEPYLTNFRRTIEHEFGHALGIVEHSATIGSVMYANNQGIEPYGCLDAESLDMWCAYNGDKCNRSELRACAIPDQYVPSDICVDTVACRPLSTPAW